MSYIVVCIVIVLIFYDFCHIFFQHAIKKMFCKGEEYIIFIVCFIGSMHYFVFNTFYLKLMLKMAPLGFRTNTFYFAEAVCLLIEIDTSRFKIDLYIFTGNQNEFF